MNKRQIEIDDKYLEIYRKEQEDRLRTPKVPIDVKANLDKLGQLTLNRGKVRSYTSPSSSPERKIIKVNDNNTVIIDGKRFNIDNLSDNDKNILTDNYELQLSLHERSHQWRELYNRLMRGY